MSLIPRRHRAGNTTSRIFHFHDDLMSLRRDQKNVIEKTDEPKKNYCRLNGLGAQCFWLRNGGLDCSSLSKTTAKIFSDHDSE